MKILPVTTTSAKELKAARPVTTTAKTEQRQPAPDTTFGSTRVVHAKKLDPDRANHMPVPQRGVHGGGGASADTLRAAIDAGDLKPLDQPPKGLGDGVDVGGGGFFMGQALIERTAFEHAGKVIVEATVWEYPGKQWFEIAAKPVPKREKPDPAGPLKARVESAVLAVLDKAPKGVKGEGVRLGPGGSFKGQPITERTAFEVEGRLFIRATVWEHPGQRWFEAK